MLRRSPSSAALLAGLLVAGCQVYDPDLVPNDAGPPPACDLRRPPDRPPTPDGDDGEEYLFGLREVFLDQEEEWRNVGFDLDGLCTEEPAFASECRPMRRSQAPSDGNEGIDNSFGADLFPLVDTAVMGLQMNARSADMEGTMPLVRVRGWNGMDDDQRVDVAITTSIFAVPAEADGSVPTFDIVNFKPRVAGEPFLPVYDGRDWAFLREDTFFEGDADRPLIRDDNAYVRDRTVVARLPDRFELVFPSMVAGVFVTLTDAVLVGHINADGSRLEGVQVAGRWAVLDLLATAENVGLCRGDPDYNILANTLDAIADVRTQPGTGGEGVICNAISLGVGFEGYRVRYAGLTPGPAITNICADGGVPSDAGVGDAGVPAVDAGPPPMDGG